MGRHQLGRLILDLKFSGLKSIHVVDGHGRSFHTDAKAACGCLPCMACLGGQGFQKGIPGGFKGIDPQCDGRNGVDGIPQGQGFCHTEPGDPPPGKPQRQRFLNGNKVFRICVRIRWGNGLPVGGRLSQHGIDKSCSTFVNVKFCHGHCGIDGGGNGDLVHVNDLKKCHAQQPHHFGVHLLQFLLGKGGDDPVQMSPPSQGAVNKGIGKGSVPP